MERKVSTYRDFAERSAQVRRRPLDRETGEGASAFFHAVPEVA